MAATVGNGDRVEIVMVEQSAHRGLPSGTSSVDTDPIEVHPRACFRCCTNPGYAVRKYGIFQIFPGDVVKLFAAMIRSHPVCLNDDAPVVGEGLSCGVAAEFFRCESAVRSS